MATITETGIQIHKKSSVVNNNAPKQPTADQLLYGEIAINYAAGYERLWIKNNEGNIVGFTPNGGSSSNAITEIILNNNTYTGSSVNLGTVLTSETQLSTASTGNGNVVTNLTVSNHQITINKNMTIPSWATASTKPSYTASEVGALATGTTLDNIADGSTRKLSDYVTNSTFTAHTGNGDIHVTASQKTTWTNKQDAISDLATIRNNASSGATAYTNVTAHTNNGDIHVTAQQKTTWTNKQDAISDLETIRNNASSGATAYSNRVTGVTITSGTSNNATFSNNQISITAVTVPTYSSSDSGKILSVNSSGQLVWITPVSIYTGSAAPNNSQGNNGDIYLQTS